MSETFDVAIVGAGIIGSACASALSARGMNVALCDAGIVGAGTTAAAMGHLVVMEDSDPQWRLTHYSRRLWREAAKKLPAEIAWHACGTLWLAESDADMHILQQKKQWLDLHEEPCSVFYPPRLRELEPALSAKAIGGLQVANDAVIYPPSAAKWLVDQALQQGCTLKLNAPVCAVEDQQIHFESGQKLRAKHTLICAGLHSTRWLPELAIVPRKGHLLITARQKRCPIRHQVLELGYLKSAHGRDKMSVAFNLQPRPTGQVLIGSSRQFDQTNAQVDAEVIAAMTARAREFVPEIDSWPALRSWTGLRPCTPDNLPYIGKTLRDNVWVAAGHEGLGVTTALGTAALIADLMQEQTPAINATPFCPQRKIVVH